MPPVDESCRQLLDLHARLERVLGDKDWSALAEVDLAIRELLLRLKGQAVLSEQASRARLLLQQLHEQARHACANECERLRRVLLSHLEYAEGRSAYQQIDLLHSRS